MWYISLVGGDRDGGVREVRQGRGGTGVGGRQRGGGQGQWGLVGGAGGAAEHHARPFLGVFHKSISSRFVNLLR